MRYSTTARRRWRDAPLSREGRRHAELLSRLSRFVGGCLRGPWRGRGSGGGRSSIGAGKFPGVGERGRHVESRSRRGGLARWSDGRVRLRCASSPWCGRGWGHAASSRCRRWRRYPAPGTCSVDWRWWRRGSRVLGLGLFLLQEVDDEGLIVHYEVVREPLRP